MHTKMHIATAAFALLMATGVSHAQQSNIPANVTGITAAYEEGKLAVEWSPAPETENIAFYRVYFSRASILENQGDYDDYERTPSAEPRFTFPAIPYRNTDLYLSVLAVNTAGVESAAFAEEARVFIPPAEAVVAEPQEPEQEIVPPEQEEEAVIPLLVTHALTLSSTEVEIHFSAPLEAAPPAEAVTIIDEQGARLTVFSVEARNARLLVVTGEQSNERVYTIASVGSVRSADGRSPDPSQTPVSFRGHTASAPEQQEETPDTTPPEDARNLSLTYRVQADGTYRVEASWEPSLDTDGDLASYELSTTRDGHTFDRNAASVGTGTLFARYNGVQAGIFGVLIRAKDAAENVSDGISKVVTLPETGVGLASLLLISGALAGRSAVKRKSGRNA